MKKSNHPGTSATVHLSLTPVEEKALWYALDFMYFYNEHNISGAPPVFDDPRFNEHNATVAYEKLSSHTQTFTKRELRAISSAIQFTIAHINDSSEIIDNIEADLPDIIADLKEAIPILEPLPLRLSAALAKSLHSK